MIRRKFPAPVETERLILRAPAVSDAPAVQAAQAESFAELHYWMKWAAEWPTLEVTAAYARQAAEHFQAGDDFPIWGFLKATGEFVLASGLHRHDWEVPKFEIGYWSAPRIKGMGTSPKRCGP